MLPIECNNSQRIRQLESWFCSRLIWVLPAVLLVSVPILIAKLRSLLYLTDGSGVFATLLSPRGAVAIVATVVIGVLTTSCYWLSLRPAVQSVLDRLSTPMMIATVFTAIFVVPLGYNVDRIESTYRELIRVRTDNPSVQKYTLQWMTDDFADATINPDHTTSIGIVGSSQIGAAIDRKVLADSLGSRIQLDFVPGMLPMQYSMLAKDISQHDFDVVVCYLSEFDFFRDEGIPSERLMWGAKRDFAMTISKDIPTEQIFHHRDDIAIIAAAQCCWWWQHRDHIRRACFSWWWNRYSKDQSPNEQTQFDHGNMNALEVTLSDLNPGHHDLVEANFLAFARFCQRLSTRGTKIVVIEGECHSRVQAAFPANSREATRKRLREILKETQGTFVSSQDLIVMFSDNDFADGTHLGASGRQKLTEAILPVLREAIKDVGVAEREPG